MTEQVPTEIIEPQPEATPAEGGASREPRIQRLWTAIFVFGRIRTLVATLGVLGFAAGIAVAWRAESAVALVVASAVLIVVAAFGPDWQEIRAAYGGAELFLRQSRDEAIVGAVTDSASFEEWRDRVERIEEQFAALESRGRLEERVDELARQLAARTRAPRSRPVLPTASALAEALASDAKVEHVMTEGGVFLRLTISGFGRVVSCDVIDPSGERRTAIPHQRPASVLATAVLAGPKTYETVYPSAFGVEELQPGPYLVEWKSKPTFTSVLARPTLVASDSFTAENGDG